MEKVSDIVQGAVTKTTPKKMKCKQAKWLPEEALQIAEERRKAKGKGGRERDTNCMQISREEQGEIRKPSLMNNAKK